MSTICYFGIGAGYVHGNEKLINDNYKFRPLLRLDIFGPAHQNPEGDFPHAADLDKYTYKRSFINALLKKRKPSTVQSFHRLFKVAEVIKGSYTKMTRQDIQISAFIVTDR